MSDTFYMVNLSPLEKSFNRGVWKELEEKVRDLA
jgi:endonuclease G